MMKNYTISECLYGVQKRQSQIDFFDNCVYGDVQAFFDYSLVKYHAQKGDKLAIKITERVNAFLTNLYEALEDNNKGRMIQLLSCLREVKQTKIGYAKSRNGKGVGKGLSKIIMESLIFMRDAMNKGNYSFLSLPLAVDNISSDRSSDILTAIALPELIQYTEDLAKKNNWKSNQTTIKLLSPTSKTVFINHKANLPIVGDDVTILYPKRFINSSANIDSIFRKFKRRLFKDYLRYDLRFASYWTDGRNYVTHDQFDEAINDLGLSFKQLLRDYIVTHYGIVDILENSLSDIRILGDEDLESLQHCRIRNIA